jgi:GPI mannosyltransferase 3
MLSIIGFDFYLRVNSKLFNRDTMVFTGLVTLQFMMRNTSPIGWIPLLFIKVFRDGAFMPFLVSAIVVAAPIILGSTLLDSYYYSPDGKFEWTITGKNFLVVNVVEGLSKYFGDHPTWQYLLVYGPAMFTVAYPLVVYSVYFYTVETVQKNQSPEMMYYTIFYFVVFSIIPHKEKRFLLPIFAFCVLSLGYLLVRKVKTWKSKILCFVWLSVIVECIVQGFYHIQHKSWIFTDYILGKKSELGEDYHPHSFFTMKRYDQPWYSLLHTPEVEKRTQIYLSQQNPDWFRRKYQTNLNLALDRQNQLCIQLLSDIEDQNFRPEYLLFES